MGTFTHYWFERGGKIFYVKKNQVTVLKELAPKEIAQFIETGKWKRKSRAKPKKKKGDEQHDD